jgi:FkbM family methyltransferase
MNRTTLENILLRTVRFYTFHTPIERGKHRAYLTALKLCKTLPERISTESRDGRRFSVHLKTGMTTTVYFLGEYEKALTEIVTSLLRPGDVCLDVGANFGWYSTLFHKHSGEQGEVHSFEPTPPTFRELEENYALMGKPSNVFINNLALGDREDELAINVFEGLPSGHASISNHKGVGSTSYACRMITLDSYMDERAVRDVNFVKVDIEGAELLFLKGAEKLFQQSIPPIFLIEMALEQTKNFGYKPNDLVEFIRARADYEFFKVDELRTRLVRMEGISPEDIGANVICFPSGAYPDRLASIEKYIA